jgi:hypothetical protein
MDSETTDLPTARAATILLITRGAAARSSGNQPSPIVIVIVIVIVRPVLGERMKSWFCGELATGRIPAWH